MSEGIKNKIGEELYNQIIAKGLNSNEFGLYNGWVPIARFDDINTKYKESNALVENLTKEKDTLNNQIKGQSLKYKQSTIKNYLKSKGAKYEDLLMKQIDIDKLEYDEEKDDFKNLNVVVDDLKKTYKDMFVTTNKSSNIKNPPSGNNNNDDSGGEDNIFSQFK